MGKKITSDKGKALVMVLIISAVIIVLGVSLVYTLLAEIKTNRIMEETETAKYLAYSSIEHGIAIIESLSDDEDPIVPEEGIVVYEETGGGLKFEYRITELAETLIKGVGRIIDNEKTVREAELNAVIDAEGKVRISK